MARGLGKGLGAMFGDEVFEPLEEESKEITSLPLIKVEPRLNQPRKRFDEVAMEELVGSIREHGIIQPLTVRPLSDGYYQIVAGERRWRAAREAGLDTVPVKVIDADDKTAMELALVENLQREDLNPMEEARGYDTLMREYGLTQEETAARVGKSRPVVANLLRLLKLPEDVMKLIEDGKLSLSLARTVLELDGDEVRSYAAHEIVNREMTVREAQNFIKRLQKPPKPLPEVPEIDYYAEVEKSLTSSLGRKVTIVKGKKRGKIEIEYYGEDDFEALCQFLNR
ncbi:MAG: ParB/RepB/Spo0J family partition protein [Oscillospiraceae bacterium]|nr:ParB/RepB/Spo0J family partition protein [Oscillospiraceae bacterium]